MPHAIYALFTKDPIALGIDIPESIDMSGIVQDHRFSTYATDAMGVMTDLLKFIEECHLEMEKRRVPDDLELMYPNRPPEEYEVEQSTKIIHLVADLAAAHFRVQLALSVITIKPIYVFDEKESDLISAALELLAEEKTMVARLGRREPVDGRGRYAQVIFSLKKALNRRMCISSLSYHADANEQLEQAVFTTALFVRRCGVVVTKEEE